MKMYVCIKQIPDPNTVVSKLDPNTRRLVRSGVSLVLDPGDESTISAAIKLRDTIGNSELAAVSMVPASAQEAMPPLIAVVTIASGTFEAIYPTMKGIMGAKKKPFSQFSLADLGIDASEVGEAGARERVETIGKVEARAAGQVIKDEGNGAQAIADFLPRYQLL